MIDRGHLKIVHPASLPTPELPSRLSDLLRVTMTAMGKVEAAPNMRLDLYKASWCRPDGVGWKLCAQGALMAFALNRGPAALSPADFPGREDHLMAAEHLTMGQVHAAYKRLHGPFYDTRRLPDDMRITPHPSRAFWEDLRVLLKALEICDATSG